MMKMSNSSNLHGLFDVSLRLESGESACNLLQRIISWTRGWSCVWRFTHKKALANASCRGTSQEQTLSCKQGTWVIIVITLQDDVEGVTIQMIQGILHR